MRSFPRSPRTWLLAASLVVLFALAGAVVVSVFLGGPAPGAPPSVVATRIVIGTGTVRPITTAVALTPTAAVALTVAPLLTPTLVVSSTATRTPTIVSPPVPPATLVLEGLTIPARKAAFIRNKDVWVVESGRGEQALTTYGDVEAIFGWNHDGTRLLLGRGRKKHAGDMSDTTELWLLELSPRQARQLTTGSDVHVAAWSPLDDRIAYCEQDNGLTLIDLSAQVLSHSEKVLCGFTWSPDGSMIVAEDYVQPPQPGFYIEDTRLIVINTRDATRTVLAQLGGYYGAVWSVDGKRFLFQWQKPNHPWGESPWNLADVVARTIKHVDVSPWYASVGPLRSPRADLVGFSIGDSIYVIDFDGKTQFSAAAQRPAWITWAPNGSTLIYRDVDGKLTAKEFPVPPASPGVGGGMPAPALYDYQNVEFYFSAP